MLYEVIYIGRYGVHFFFRGSGQYVEYVHEKVFVMTFHVLFLYKNDLGTPQSCWSPFL